MGCDIQAIKHFNVSRVTATYQFGNVAWCYTYYVPTSVLKHT